ncbi:MAG TPA: hypothetical protein PKC69_09450 [Chitinophagaceae bacterium]|nr:hypothetical protein [Chitinophagaceae bacterium]
MIVIRKLKCAIRQRADGQQRKMTGTLQPAASYPPPARLLYGVQTYIKIWEAGWFEAGKSEPAPQFSPQH